MKILSYEVRSLWHNVDGKFTKYYTYELHLKTKDQDTIKLMKSIARDLKIDYEINTSEGESFYDESNPILDDPIYSFILTRVRPKEMENFLKTIKEKSR